MKLAAENIVKKGAQIGWMQKLYSSANSLVVCKGKGEEEEKEREEGRKG